jgi:hypothetical protein
MTTKRAPLDWLAVGALSIGGVCVSIVLVLAAGVVAFVRFVMFMSDGEWPRMTACTIYRYANSPTLSTYAVLADSRCSYSFSLRGFNVIADNLFNEWSAFSLLLLAGLAGYAFSWGLMILYAYVRDN